MFGEWAFWPISFQIRQIQCRRPSFCSCLWTWVWGPAPTNPICAGVFWPLVQRTRWHLRRKSRCLCLALKHPMLNASLRWQGHSCTTHPAYQLPPDHANLRHVHRAFLLSRICEHSGLIGGGLQGPEATGLLLLLLLTCFQWELSLWQSSHQLPRTQLLLPPPPGHLSPLPWLPKAPPVSFSGILALEAEVKLDQLRMHSWDSSLYLSNHPEPCLSNTPQHETSSRPKSAQITRQLSIAENFNDGELLREETLVPQADTQRSPKPVLLLSALITTAINDNNYKSYLHNTLQVTKHIHRHYFI